MVVDLAKLEQMRAIARAGNLTRAAEEIGITQPALSRTVSLLERRFGFRIFDRGRSGVSLTREGTLLMHEAELLLRQARTMEHNLDLHQRGEAGELSVGVGPQIAGLLLPSISVHLLRTRPGVRLNCILDTADRLLPGLMDGNIELILCASNFIAPTPDLLIEPLGTMKLSILARAGHPLADKPDPVMADLSAYSFALESDRAPPGFPVCNGGISCESSHILRDVVIETDALWFSSSRAVSKEIADGVIIEIPIADLPLRHVEIGLVRLARRSSPPVAEIIAEFVREFLAQNLGEADQR